MDGDGMDSGGGLQSFLDMLKAISGQGHEEFEALATLNDDQMREWSEIMAMGSKAQEIMREATARKELFWIRLRRALGPDGDRDTIRIDGNIVMGSKRRVPEAPDDLQRLTG